MKVTGHEVWSVVKDFVIINLGMAIYDIGWAAFLLPYTIPSGGMAGAAAILQYATGFPMQTTIMIVNMILLVVAWWQLGAKFALKTAYAVFSLVIYLQVGQDIMTDPSTGNLIQILGEGETSMACVLGSVLNGVGIGVVLTAGACTGGWDIVAAVVNKHRNVSMGRVMLYLDLVVISSTFFIFGGDWRMVVYGLVTLLLYTNIMDMVVNSSKQDVQITIYSKKHAEIAEAIRKKTGHTNTLLLGESGYHHDELKVEVVIVHKREVVPVLRLIRDIDPRAFVTQHRVEGVYGEGFNVIKG